MYQNCCKKCGSISLHTEAKGSNIGLYCNDCGAWQKWISKDDFRAFKYNDTVKKENEDKQKVYDAISKPTCVNFSDEITIKERLEEFVDHLNKIIDYEYEMEALSTEDLIRKNSYCMALERDKNAIISILNGKRYYEIID